ncbi:hypothetical protein [Crocosphaera sp. XPORK-15E]|uniref:hypothetical protein n=1 Tax=Crocosphaera sp. XPORK-15E TaxID=3110247 RepID=UPI002B20BBA1|nr:hypothetical protein [Crocosphaera sp. XPORK-15E]MEA5535466.1 hypothetical protein [Crocosphaera sp. XPORK-15E]
MSTVTENDLKELKDLIISNHKVLETKLTSLETRLTSLEKGQTDLKDKLTGIDKQLGMVETRLEDWKPAIDKIPDLAEKVGELKNWRQFVIITLTATISGVLGWFLRGGNLKP